MPLWPGRHRATGAPNNRLGRAERDILLLGVVAASIILFVGTGSNALTAVLRATFAKDVHVDPLLTTAMLLNVALIIFGWRRHTELSREVNERRRAEHQATLLAQTDPLTGCLNRRSIGIATADLIRAAHAHGRRAAVMMMDLDRFKPINDVYGHQCGDAVLVELVERVRNVLPLGAVLARLGGDEFACVVGFDPARPETVEAMAEAIVAAVAEPFVIGPQRIDTSASIGLAAETDQAAQGALSPEACARELLHRADLAMYHAKKNGRSRHAWFEPTMARAMIFRSELEREIREGIPRGEFVPFYEKQVDLLTGEIVGFEMLARWQSPRHGLVGPDLFIPIAEEIGVIAQISETLIAQALREAREWNEALTLAVNISPVQLRDPWFAQKLLKLLVEVGFPPARLEVEITETCLHENLGVVRSQLVSLRNQGVIISLDDFGTGYSSLSQLRVLPFDRLKIDRSFVTSLADSPESHTILEAIASLGRGMGLPIVAEGVESAAVRDALAPFGICKGQGYFYGEPGNAAQVHEWLEAASHPPGPRLAQA